MARVEGVDPRQTSFAMRQVFKRVRKMLGQRNLHAAEDRRSSAASVLGERSRRMAIGTKSSGPATTSNAAHVANGDAGRLSILNRC